MARPKRGFTLIEVLVTITILAVLAGMAWRGVDSLVRTKTISEARLDGVLRLNTVLAQWETDLATLYDTEQVPAIQFDGASLRLTRRTEDGVQMVVWTLRDGSWNRWAAQPVVRKADLQEQWMRAQQLLGNEVGTVRALPGVLQWQVYFWRDNAWTNPQSTGDIDSKPPGEGSGTGAGTGGPAGNPVVEQLPPQGVRLVLTAAPGSGLNGSYTRDTVLRVRTE